MTVTPQSDNVKPKGSAALGLLVIIGLVLLGFWGLGAIFGGGGHPVDEAFDPMTMLDKPGYQACLAFAVEHPKAHTALDRERLATEINTLAGRSESYLLADNAEPLMRTFDGPLSTWQLAGDTFARTCLDRGWE